MDQGQSLGEQGCELSDDVNELPDQPEAKADPMADDRPRAPPSRGVFLLPNLITTGALFSGFYAIVAAAHGDFALASTAVFVAMVLDAADGRVARLTRTESNFGAQYDSLSDMVAFGVAPGMLAFFWGLTSLGKLGWAATFVYTACAALRLARFNVAPDNSSFTGLASPSAAAIVAGSVWVLQDLRIGPSSGPAIGYVACFVLVALGLLMVSNLTYFSPKKITVKGRVPFVSMVALVLVFAVLLIDPPRVLLGLFVLYALSGPAGYFWKRTRTK